MLKRQTTVSQFFQLDRLVVEGLDRQGRSGVEAREGKDIRGGEGEDGRGGIVRQTEE